MSKRVRKTADEAQIDMTPMLDVTFIMLIFFIVTASFTKEDGIDLTQSNNDTPLNQQNTKSVSIVIDVNGNSEVIMEGRAIDPRSVQANVQRLKAENPEANVVVRAAQGAQAQVMVTVVDQARLAGVSGVIISELNER